MISALIAFIAPVLLVNAGTKSNTTAANNMGTKHDLTTNTSATDTVKAYQSKIPFKQFIMKNIGLAGVRGLVASEFGSENTFCPDLKSALGNTITCDPYLNSLN